MRYYCTRWLTDDAVRDDDDLFFGGSDSECIANPGQHYLTNKYYELLAALELLEEIDQSKEQWNVESLKLFIERYCYDKIHVNPPKKYLGLYAVLLHLSNPEKYESIISKKHRELIPVAFADLLEKHASITCPEEQIKLIRELLYDSYGKSTDPIKKYRWFFYSDDLIDIWKSTRVVKSSSNRARQEAFILDEIQREAEYDELSAKEGGKVKSTSYRILRDTKIVNAVKQLENYSCQVCNFSFKKQIVHVHHLDPISERTSPRDTKCEDLITLCPNCHYLAHYLLRTEKTNDELKERAYLIERLQKLIPSLRLQLAIAGMPKHSLFVTLKTKKIKNKEMDEIQITINNPQEVITLYSEDNFGEVSAKNQNGKLIGSFVFFETEG